MTVTYHINIRYSSGSEIILSEQEYNAFVKIFEGGNNGANLKPIKGQENLYSAYLNYSARLLFVEEENGLRLVDKFESHDEYMEKLKQKGLAERYLQKLSHLSKEEFDIIFSANPHPDSDYSLSDEKRASLKSKVNADELPVGLYYTLEGTGVLLNEKQKLLHTKPPQDSQMSYTRLIQGGPGTGKTLTLMSDFEKDYGKANQIAAQPETKHSSEEIQQFLYLSTTSDLANKALTHFNTVIPNKILPCLSLIYQDFVAMIDPSIPPLSLSISALQNKGQARKYKILKTESDFLTWCKEQKIKPEDYLESSEEDKTPFYTKLYQEFRILCGYYPDLNAYQTLGVQESLFPQNELLQKSLYDLYTRYTKDFVDLNFYDLRPAIKRYKTEYPHLIPHIYADEAQNLSRIQALNVIEYTKIPENLFLSINTDQSVFDPISNLKFIKRYFESKKINILSVELDECYRSPLPMITILRQISILENQYKGGVDSKTNQDNMHCSSDKVGKIIPISDAYPNKVALLEECKKLCKESNCAVIVGHASLIKKAEAEFDTKLVWTSDKIIGLQFKHIIFLDPFAGFSQDELESLAFYIEKMNSSTLFVNRPKDKHDKTKHLILPKLKKINVAISRALESLRLIAADEPKLESTKKRSKQKVSLQTRLFEYLMKNSEMSSKSTLQDEPVRTPLQIHQGWVERCSQLILDEKDYERAKEIFHKENIKPEELNLKEELKTLIPVEFHELFFKLMVTTTSLTLEDSKPQQTCEAKTPQENKKSLPKMTPITNSVEKGESPKNKTEAFQNVLANDPKVLYELGHSFEFGKNGKELNLKKAVEYYRLSSEKNFGLAYYDLGRCYENGIGVEKDATQALNLFKLGSAAGDHNSSCTLGIYHQDGLGGLEKNTVEARKCFELSIVQGKHPRAHYLMGYYYEYGMGGLEKDLAKALKHYQLASEGKYVLAYYAMGLYYEYGKGVVEIDYTKALYYYELAANQGNADASCALGRFYDEGIGGLEVDQTKAVAFFKVAAEQNCIKAKYHLGRYLIEGCGGIEKNKEEGLKNIQLASEGGFGLASYALGCLHEHGRYGLSEDRHKALDYFILANKQKDKSSVYQYKIGEYYTLGYGGLKVDHAEALEYYRLASSKGEPESQCLLGIYHEFGLGGLEKNSQEALKFYIVSTQNGSKTGKANLIRYCADEGLDLNAILKQSDSPKSKPKTAEKSATEPNIFGNIKQYLHDLFSNKDNTPTDIQSILFKTKTFEKPLWDTLLEKNNIADLISVINDDKFSKIFIAATQEYPKAQYYIGKCYEEGLSGLKKNLNYAIKFYNAASEQGYPAAKNRLGERALEEFKATKDYRKATLAHQYFSTAMKDYPMAQYNFGMLHYKGIGVPKDPKKAVHHFTLAAAKNLSAAQFKLGKCYEKSIGVKQDLNKAAKCYQMAAEQGHTRAQYYLGICLKVGNGAERDYSEARRCFQLASDNNYAKAKCELGVCYRDGSGGIQQNFVQARNLFQSASDLGDPLATYYLGNCYELGQGVAINLEKAQSCYESIDIKKLELFERTYVLESRRRVDQLLSKNKKQETLKMGSLIPSKENQLPDTALSDKRKSRLGC